MGFGVWGLGFRVSSACPLWGPLLWLATSAGGLGGILGFLRDAPLGFRFFWRAYGLVGIGRGSSGQPLQSLSSHVRSAP